MNKISVKALIIQKNKILLLKPKNLQGSFNGWDGPGGHIEEGESIMSALKREVYEETKIKIVDAYPIKLLHIPQTKTDYLIFLCKALGDEVTLSEEHIDYKWLDLPSFQKIIGGYFSSDLIEIQKMIKKLLRK